MYLSEEQATALRRTARATGRSQAELIREGVDLVTAGSLERIFHSMGVARSSGASSRDADAELALILDERLARDRLVDDIESSHG